MKYLLFFIAPCFLGCAQSKKYELPARWEKTFSIHIYNGGGMNYASTNAWFHKDSCRYVEMEQGVDKVKKFKLNESELKQVLDSLRIMNVEYMKTEPTGDMAHDKATTSVCLQDPKKQNCLSSGATENVTGKGSENFYGVYRYLLGVARRKGK